MTFSKIFLSTVALMIISFGYLFLLPLKMMINSVLTTDFVSQSIMTDIRNGLTEQDSFRTLLENHRGGPKRYLFKTNMISYTTVDFQIYDVYAMYINNKKKWVVRLGIYPDKNAEVFFSNQVGGVVGTVLSSAMGLLNHSLSKGWISPILYHVTDNASTSFTSSSYKSVDGLVN